MFFYILDLEEVALEGSLAERYFFLAVHIQNLE